MNYRQKTTIFIGILGTALEWLEYSYYGYLTTRISQLFFPQYDARTGLFASFAIFAAGFIMRPLGGLLFGFIGDSKGRRIALFWSLLLMGCSTLLMGLLPTYEQIGIYAPIALLLCRLLQGLAVSGEYNGAAIFLIEHHKTNYPILAGSWVGAASAFGMLMGAFCAILVAYPGMPTWSWRVPFFFAFFSCLIANYLRYRMAETPAFLTSSNQRKLIKYPLKEIMTSYRKPFVFNMLLAAFVSVYIYVGNVYFASFLIKERFYSMSQATSIVAFGELIVVISFPFAALLAERFGHKRIMLIGLLGTLLATPLLFSLTQTHSLVLNILAELFFGLTNALVCAPIFHFIYTLFPTEIRYTGNSTAWGLGVALFGGSAPTIAHFLTDHYSYYAPSFYVGLFTLIAIIVIMRAHSSESNNKQPASINLQAIN